MNQNPIRFNLNTGIYHKVSANKLSGLIELSQGFLADDRVWSNATIRLKIHAVIEAYFFYALVNDL